MSWQVIEADCVEAMREMDEASVDAICTDPPYGLEFMGKEWDRLIDKRDPRDTAKPELQGQTTNPYSSHKVNFVAGIVAQDWHQAWATEALRVLKPGGHLLAFGGTRTYHRLACAVEDAGFEIRDSVIWLYGSGFPKSLNVGNGFGTALKPAHEPIVVARKPLIGTVAQNVERFSTGALNIDATRIQAQAGDREDYGLDGDEAAGIGYHGLEGRTAYERPEAGRWPANVVLSGDAVAELDRQSGESRSSGGRIGNKDGGVIYGAGKGLAGEYEAGDPGYGDRSRFFYVAKASRSERNAGLEGFEERPPSAYRFTADGDEAFGAGNPESPRGPRLARQNVHPTVKPVDLMRWLCRLVTPPDGTVLDPFAGSGTTGIACVLEDFDFIGIEREAEYVEIARARIDYWARQPKQLGLLDDVPEKPKGRWPANVALSHLEGCELVGTKRVRSYPGQNRNTDAGFTGTVMKGAAGRPAGTVESGYGDADGFEAVEDWRCVEGCPVAELDRQSA